MQRWEQARAFLRQQLATGPQPMQAVVAAAEAAGIRKNTLLAEKSAAGVISRRLRDGWEWSLAAASAEPSAELPPVGESPPPAPEAPAAPGEPTVVLPVAATDLAGVLQRLATHARA